MESYNDEDVHLAPCEIKKELNNSTDDTNLQQLRDSESSNNDNNKFSNFSDAQIRLSALKTGLQDKGSLLSHTWTELNEMLSEYQAELFTAQGKFLKSHTKYEGVTDLEHLKIELVQKENENSELKNTITDLENQQNLVQMDLSVKDGLLKKYQEDLLTKEASILTILSTNKKLESRVALLEAKIGSNLSHSQRPMPGSLLHHTPAGFKRRTSLGAMQTPPKRRQLMHHQTNFSRPPMAPMPSSLDTNVSEASTSGASSILPSTNTHPHPHTPTSQASMTKPIVCIEVDDEEIQEINDSLSQPDSGNNSSDNLYMDAYTDGDNTTAPDHMGSASQYNTNFNDHYTSQQLALDTSADAMNSLMMQEANSSMMGDMPGVPKDGARAKICRTLHPCTKCDKKFTYVHHLRRHVKNIHENLYAFHCSLCPRKCKDRTDFERHLNTKHDCKYCTRTFINAHELGIHILLCSAADDVLTISQVTETNFKYEIPDD